MSERNPTLSREDKARLLVKHVVITVKGKSAMCPSFTDPSKMYHINIEEGNCECPDNTHRGINCMHMQAVDFKELEIKMEEEAIEKISTVCNELEIEDVEPKSKWSVRLELPLKNICDQVGIEDTQALIRKDLLLEDN